MAAGAIMGILQQPPEDWFAVEPGDIDAAAIEQLLQDRAAARAVRDFAAADAVRDKLTEMGVVIEDTPEGTKWHLAR